MSGLGQHLQLPENLRDSPPWQSVIDQRCAGSRGSCWSVRSLLPGFGDQAGGDVGGQRADEEAGGASSLGKEPELVGGVSAVKGTIAAASLVPSPAMP